MQEDDIAYRAILNATVDHLKRQMDAAVQTRGGRIKTRDLYTEAERILAKTASGMSLLERISRDTTFRDDLVELIRELQNEAEEPLVVQSKETKKKSKMPRLGEVTDQPMKDVNIQFAR